MTDPAPTSIDRFNAFMERGWLAVLSPTELHVWLCYHKHADANGISWPSSSTAAAYVDHSGDAHVRAARLRLVEYGLLIPMKRSRLPGGALKSPYRVVVADPPADSRGPKVQDALADKRSKVERLEAGEVDDQPFGTGTAPTANRSEVERLEKPTVPLSTANRSTSERATVPVRGTEQTIEQTIEQKDEDIPPRSVGERAAVKQRRMGDPAVVAIYDAYPRKVGRGHALKAITVALRNLERKAAAAPGGEAWESWLLDRVRQYAAARARKLDADPDDDPSWTPHPATWFNAQKFDDDPAEWERIKKGPKNGHARHGSTARQPHAAHLAAVGDVPDFGT